jgi:hypothetical protein
MTICNYTCRAPLALATRKATAPSPGAARRMRSFPASSTSVHPDLKSPPPPHYPPTKSARSIPSFTQIRRPLLGHHRCNHLWASHPNPSHGGWQVLGQQGPPPKLRLSRVGRGRRRFGLLQLSHSLSPPLARSEGIPRCRGVPSRWSSLVIISALYDGSALHPRLDLTRQRYAVPSAT